MGKLVPVLIILPPSLKWENKKSNENNSSWPVVVSSLDHDRVLCLEMLKSE